MNKVQSYFENYLNKKSIFVNKEVLLVKYVPEQVLHRDEQIQQLTEILAPSLKNEKPSNIFIYGKTGTGKTVVTKYICSQLHEVAKKNNNTVSVIYINCKMRKVTDTEYRLISQLIREFGKEVPYTGLPTNEIYQIFFKTIDDKNQVIILILDEIDNLVKKCGDEILYNLTRINSELKNAKLSIIGITNDVTFIDELDPRVRSSLNEEEIVFQPYDAMQLRDILWERAKLAFAPNSISEDVISKCAAYAAREHGDARRAIELLRVAAEIAEREGSEIIAEKHVDQADEKIEFDKVIEIVKRLPKQSQVLLYSIILLNKNKNSIIYTGEVYDVYKNICQEVRINGLTQRRLSDLIAELDLLGIIRTRLISKGRYGKMREISLMIDPETINKIELMIKEQIGV
jgi:cell division control protein 6